MMRIRIGHVSNSSTTSFTCEVCGEEWVGWDSVSMNDVGFYRCVHEHTICEGHLLVGVDDALEESMTDEERDDYGDGGYLPERCCPICQFEEISMHDLVSHLLRETKVSWDAAFEHVKSLNKRRKKLYDHEYVAFACSQAGIDQLTVADTIKDRFGSYGEFRAFIDGKDD
jgi:hypothetical protein